MDKEKFTKACKLLYHFCEKGFTEESILELIPEFGTPILTTILCPYEISMICVIEYGEYSVWVGRCDDGGEYDFRGTHVAVENTDLHLVAPEYNSDLTEGLLELTDNLKRYSETK